MTKKHVRMKKSFWVLMASIIILVIGIISYNAYHNYITSTNYLLKKKGYTEEEINKVKTNKDIINELLKRDYNKDIISIMTSKYYISKNLDKYIEYKTKYTTKKYSDVIAIINVKANLDWYTKTSPTDMTKDDLILVNKFHYLEEDYEIEDLVDISVMYAFKGKKIKVQVYDAFKSMFNAAKKEGLTIVANSAYRTYSHQESIYNNIKNSKGKTYADNYAARPGFSEHQTGLAIDVSTLNSSMDNFEDTDEFKWLLENAHKFGFILRYPKGKEYLTGYNYESWHYRYVGVKVATQIKNEDITFDEYYAYYEE